MRQMHARHMLKYMPRMRRKQDLNKKARTLSKRLTAKLFESRKTPSITHIMSTILCSLRYFVIRGRCGLTNDTVQYCTVLYCVTTTVRYRYGIVHRYGTSLQYFKAPSSIGREVLVRGNQDCSRRMSDAPPHLLAVGDGSALDPGLARLRQEAKRGARRRRRHDRRRDHAASAVTCVFLHRRV